MNIRRAKQEIMDTIASYLLKDQDGDYVIPRIRQRPVLLLGAPGIGKTQIMEQVARECGIALVSYTITHHTRQSAIGLPFISRKQFGGREYAVTEYTMSEIIASVYEKMEETGLNEGILFLDEINCVSETLAPAMLQFLQCKTFGTHELPPGWILVAAGNPPEYNRSVREFDVVTMDRVKKIEVEPDFAAWREYAGQAQIHPAVISYLTARSGYFYRMETTVDGKQFATPRGWEDLSRLLEVYEKLGRKVDREVAVQYIQHEKIAKDFANYLELFEKYQMDYRLEEVLAGRIDETLLKKAAHASFDERLGVVSLLLSRCSRAFADISRREQELDLLFADLKKLKDGLYGGYSSSPQELVDAAAEDFGQRFARKKKAKLLSGEDNRVYRSALLKLESLGQELKLRNLADGAEAFAYIRERFDGWQDALEEQREQAGLMLEHAFDFMEAAFGPGQELVIFISEINADVYCLRFLREYECERYYRYNQSLLIEDNSRAIEERLRSL